MKRLSISLPALALAMTLLLSSATPRHQSLASPASSAAARKVYMYYWYTWPGDTFIDYNDLVDEELEWLIWTGVWTDTNPMGGTLVARGYMTNNYPHVAYASAYLYEHLTQ